MNLKLELEQIKIIRAINFRIKHHKTLKKPLEFWIAVERPASQNANFRGPIKMPHWVKWLYDLVFLDRVLKVICQSEIVIMDAIIIILIYNAESHYESEGGIFR